MSSADALSARGPLAHLPPGPGGRLAYAELNDVVQITRAYQSASAADREKLLPLADSLEQDIERKQMLAVWGGGSLAAFSGFAAFPGGFVETRSCYVSPNFRGFGLQRLLHLARAALAGERWHTCSLVSAVKPPGEATKRNLAALGFLPWPAPAVSLFEACRLCTTRPPPGAGRRCCCDYYVLDDRRRRLLAVAFRDENIARLTRRDGAVFEVLKDL